MFPLTFRFLISKDYKDALLQFGPITPDSPSIDAEEPKYPRSSELEGKLAEATKNLLENVQTPETGDDQQQGESFDTDLQQEEMEKYKSGGEQKETEKGFSDVEWQLVDQNA